MQQVSSREKITAVATGEEDIQPALIWETSVRVSIDLSKCLEPGEEPPTVQSILKDLLEDHPLVDGVTIESYSEPRIVDYNKPNMLVSSASIQMVQDRLTSVPSISPSQAPYEHDGYIEPTEENYRRERG